MMKKNLLVPAFAMCIHACLFAQISPIKDLLPKLTPTSAEATGLGRFGNYKVNLFTGLPDISIPIFEIRVGELNVPISISYHPAGIKVNDIASWAGLGWSVQTGGAISRKVVGGPDEFTNNYLSATSTSANRTRLSTEINTNTTDGLNYLSQVYLNYYDVSPDIFSYSFPGHSGKFLFNQKNNFAPFLIPYDPITITPTYSAPNLSAFDIIDESGIDYKFNAGEFTSSGSGTTINAMSAWMLTNMISSNKQDSIYFNFSQSSYRTIDTYFSDYITVSDNVHNFLSATYYSEDIGTSYYDVGNVSTMQQIISEIKFKNGKISFEAAAGSRTDFNGIFNLQNRLQYIKVFSYDPVNNLYNLLKKYELFHSYFGSGSAQRLRLDSIQVTGGASIVQTYKFDYNLTTNLPDHFSKQKDFWGYFNYKNGVTASGVTTTVPRTQITFTGVGGSSTLWIGAGVDGTRDPDPNYMQANILQKVTYPTGGNTQFEFETNQYQENTDPPKYAGGLRIKKIKSYTDPSANPIVKTYRYGTNESGYGRKNFLANNNFMAMGRSYKYIAYANDPGCDQSCSLGVLAATKNLSTYFAGPTLDLDPYDGSPVVYPVVTEYTGDQTTNIGKTVYQFNDRPDALNTSTWMNSSVFDSYHFIRGMLTNKSVYRINADNSYSILAETRNTYQQNPYEWSTGGIGLTIFKQIIYQNHFGEFVGGLPTNSPADETHSYSFGNYVIPTSDNKLTSNTEIAYDQNNSANYVSKTTNYTYDDKTHLQLIQSQTVNSKNESINSYFIHPYNYSTAPYTTMTTNHIYAKVVQDSITNSVTGLLSKQINNYLSFAGNNYLPGTTQLQIKSNPIETRANFNQYDTRGNILEMQKTNDAKQSYIWDYQNMYPIAEVANAAQNQIAYTSFEADGNGNWIISDVTRSTEYATGNRSYILNSSNYLAYYFASGGINFTLSYWSKDGQVNMSGVTLVSTITGATKNGWTYYEHTITASTGNTITLTASAAKTIDELRLYPSTALMTTYTHAPLVGMTSQCSQNNTITYFTYDAFNRLKTIRDADGNIIKTYEYQFQGQNIFY
jgi:YD repeat-containing protein